MREREKAEGCLKVRRGRGEGEGGVREREKAEGCLKVRRGRTEEEGEGGRLSQGEEGEG